MDIGNGHGPQRLDWLGDAFTNVVAPLSATRADGHLATFIELDGPHEHQWSLALALRLLAGPLMGMKCATVVAEVDLFTFLVQALCSQYVISIDLGGETVGEQNTTFTRVVSYLPE